MIKNLVLFIGLLTFSNHLLAKRVKSSNIDLLKKACRTQGGEMRDKFTCPTSGDLRKGPFCLLPDKRFFNGCTGSISPYGRTFFKACLQHDHCYHHEPSTNGKEKSDCDRSFLQNMKSICQQEHNNSHRCHLMAFTFYKATKRFGHKSWECSDTYVDSY